MSEQTFVRELERRADDVQPRHLRFEDVRASAYRIRRRRRVAVAGGVAAVVAAAILVPTALLGGSPKSDRPRAGPARTDDHAGPDGAVRPRRAPG